MLAFMAASAYQQELFAQSVSVAGKSNGKRQSGDGVGQTEYTVTNSYTSKCHLPDLLDRVQRCSS